MTTPLLLFMLINFADKVVVRLAAQPVMAELKLSPEQFGLLGSSFFFLLAVSGVVVGFITNRAQTRHMLLVMAIIWSVVQFPMLGTVTLEMLIACRIILGRGECRRAFHPARHLQVVPDPLRGVPTAIIAQGSAWASSSPCRRPTGSSSPILALGIRRARRRGPCLLWMIFGREGTLVDQPGQRRRGHGRACRTAICSPAPASSPPGAPASRATEGWRSAVRNCTRD